MALATQVGAPISVAHTGLAPSPLAAMSDSTEVGVSAICDQAEHGCSDRAWMAVAPFQKL